MENKSEYMGEVRLLSHTINPEQLCGNIAKICYGKEFDENADGLKVLRKIVSEGHESVIEHAVFTFYLRNVSRVFTHELVRHRIASFTQKSTRYSSNADIGIPVDYAQYGSAVCDAVESYETYIMENYDALIQSGMPKDEARYFLPMGLNTDIVVTMNARELRHFFNLRLCSRATQEMQHYARLMYNLCKEIAPLLFEGCDAPCTIGRCTRMCDDPVVLRGNDE